MQQADDPATQAAERPDAQQAEDVVAAAQAVAATEAISAARSGASPAGGVTQAGNSPTEVEGSWARLLADPGHSPELLALAAVQTLGPRASVWAQQVREAYPAATSDAVARLAVRQFTRFGSVSGVFAAVAGSYAPVALVGASALTHAELSLHVAAAYGLDPADEARAVDLLVLSRVHPSREDAVAALTAAKEFSYESTGLTDAAWRLGRMITSQAGVWAALRVVNRFFPGTSLLAATLSSRAAARTSAARATLYYRVRAS
ncbi:hypothetical protein [Actinoplanes sp. NPDC051494]|uniref:hypothetical protein n=1 Tax=Actinoplanes sp. NPDC051494 TaxID=3363907 RepID=UPI0037B44F8C